MAFWFYTLTFLFLVCATGKPWHTTPEHVRH